MHWAVPTVNVCKCVKMKQEVVCKEHALTANPSLVEMKKVKNICVSVICVLFEHLTADGLVFQ